MKSKLIASILSLMFVGGVGNTITNNFNSTQQSGADKIVSIETSDKTLTNDKDELTDTEANNEIKDESINVLKGESESTKSAIKTIVFKKFWCNNSSQNNKPNNVIIGTIGGNVDCSKPIIGIPTIPEEKPEVVPPVVEEKPEVVPPVVEEKPEVVPPVAEEKPEVVPPVVEEKPEVVPPVVEEKPEVVPPVAEEQAPSVNTNFMAEVEQAIFNKVNEERTKAGVSPLTYNYTMQKYARIKSQDMGDNNYFSHEDLNGNLITMQMKNDGVSYNAWGENIAYLQGYSAETLADKFMTNWMNSQGHRANILSTNFSGIGVGVYKVGTKVYATQEFYR